MAPSRTSISTKACVLAAATLLQSVHAAGPIASLFKRDPPGKVPGCATDGDKKWQPAMDFDTDGCYNTPAIGADGALAEGLDNCYTSGESGCRDESDLDNNNVYVRARCNNGWCGHIYGYYFEKDVALEHVCGVGAGHRNDWEHIVVFVQNDEAKYVATSAHGGYNIRPAEEVRWEDTHPKVVYHKDGAGTHAFRFANEDDDNIENHKGVWFYGDLLSHLGWPDDALRDSMMGNDWGSASIDFKDDNFADKLQSAKGDKDIALDTSFDDDTSPGEPAC